MEFLPTAKELSGASDRYLFLLVLMVLGGFAWAVLQKVLKLHEQARDDAAEAHKSANTIRDKWESTSATLAVSIDRNTEVVKSNTAVLAQCQKTHEDVLTMVRQFQGKDAR